MEDRILKLPARKLSLRKRFMALTANERCLSTLLIQLFVKFLSIFREVSMVLEETRRIGAALGRLIIVSITMTITYPNIVLPREINKRRSIASFSDTECWNLFETRKEDLLRLQAALRIPLKVNLENGSTMRGEEVIYYIYDF